MFEYESDPNGMDYTFRQNPFGHWDEVVFNPKTNRWNLVIGGCGLVIGVRERYVDPFFKL